MPLAASAQESSAPVPGLDPAKWSPRNHAALRALLAQHGKHSPRYDATRKPYAVFDWDNTAIMNDTEEALFMYQINTLSFRLTPAEFGAIIRQNVPVGPFSADYNNSAGLPVTLEDIAADLDASYGWLHAQYRGFQGSQTLEAIRDSVQFQDFRAKLYYLYEAVNGTHGCIRADFRYCLAALYFHNQFNTNGVRTLWNAAHPFERNRPRWTPRQSRPRRDLSRNSFPANKSPSPMRLPTRRRNSAKKSAYPARKRLAS